MRDSFLSHKSLIVPAGERRRADVSGDFFVCSEALEPFGLQIDDGEQFDVEVGLEVRLKGNDSFKRLNFYNPSANENTIQFYTGRGVLQDKRLNSRIGRIAATVKNAYSATVPGYAFTYPAGYTETFTGLRIVFALGLPTDVPCRRKSVVVTNLDTMLDLQLRDGAGNTIATVVPRQPWTAEIMDDFSVHNPNGVTVSGVVEETFYAP